MDYFKNVSLSKNDENHLVLKINEDVEAGTLIDLNAITDIDTSFVAGLNNLIESGKDEVYNEKLRSLKEDLKNRFDKAITQVEQKSKEKYESELKVKLAEKDSDKTKEISDLKNMYEKKVNDLEAHIENYNVNKENEISKIKLEKLEEINKVKSDYEECIKEKDNQISKRDGEIESLKNYRISLSTKGVGEDLEQWCYNEFNKHRSMGFMNDTFEKDNDTKNETKTKADFIYRCFDDNKETLFSIMFEMKNQTETDGKKHKNEDFYHKLNKDRESKRCDYAVLVSMLEPENDYFNVGIQDVSYAYPNMFVIRPQFLMPFISLIKNEAQKTAKAKKELIDEQNKKAYVSNFEHRLSKLKGEFTKNYIKANVKFKDAIKGIDSTIEKLSKTIDELEKTKKALQQSENNLDRANDALGDLTIKKLTHGNQEMKKMLEEHQNDDENELRNDEE